MGKKAFVGYTSKGKIVPGSLILTNGTCPKGPGRWGQVSTDLCCNNLVEFTWDGEDVSLNYVSLNIKCDGVIIKTVYSNASSSNAANLESLLNNAFGLIGTFTVVGTVVTLSMTETQKNEFCPNSTFSFELFQD